MPNAESSSPLTIPSRARSSVRSQRSRPNSRSTGEPSAAATGRSSNVSSLISDDLPEPFGPRIAVCSPGQTVNESW